MNEMLHLLKTFVSRLFITIFLGADDDHIKIDHRIWFCSVAIDFNLNTFKLIAWLWLVSFDFVLYHLVVLYVLFEMNIVIIIYFIL